MISRNGFIKAMLAVAIIAIAASVHAERPLSVESVKISRTAPCSYSFVNTSFWHEHTQSGDYPQISGLSNRRFQDEINAEIKKQADKFLPKPKNDTLDADGSISFKVLENDGKFFVVKLSAGYPSCGGNAYTVEEKMITIDVLNNKTTIDRWSLGERPLYPSSAVKMSVSEINQVITGFKKMQKSFCGEMSNLRGDTFVIDDGYVAIEVYLKMDCVSHAEEGYRTIPLYRLDGLEIKKRN